MSSLPHFLLYIGVKNIYPAQEGSIWRKIRKTVLVQPQSHEDTKILK